MQSALSHPIRVIATVALLSIACTALAADPPRPDADYGPAEVIGIVLEALQRNPTAQDDAGIATVFSFASPGNRAATGPLERFRTMIKRGYPDMLGFSSSRSETMQLDGDEAVQIVWLMQPDGRETGYAFQLARQSGGDYDGMWMTDAVVPLGEGPRSGTRI